MAKIVFIFLIQIALFSQTLFDKRCIPCHQKKHIDLKAIYFNYILYHSSKSRTLKAIRKFLLHPDPKKSLLPYDYKKRTKGVYKHKIKEKELEKALEIYWTRYTVIGKIR
ncbi:MULTISPECIES: hypothetical protein [unclassified Nitratiruptor]|uniref:hypothetical protein n=1 Tax=unclassified Nitratiruptor TaxID=2624044 RepID=UPI001915C9DC|nr:MULTISPECIES: hypothetical protein [unclassified Nitratiruptor]BCD60604.1 hypothetical protein NitYY0810_C1379 [Nitratiruptor sp. YY08-10]BCD64535.1 hypothetical protein NitYY0814_C1386 [Nitratiruptor sp. YY08-14]